MKYKVGDKVRVRNDLVVGKKYCMENSKKGDVFVEMMSGMRGKIVTINDVRGGTYHIGESLFNWTDEMLEPVHSQKIVITTDGAETLARLYDGDKVVKTASAKCAPEDTFDFSVGAKLAFERLMGEEKKDETTETTCKFKVGDRVRVISKSTYRGERAFNETATIICLAYDACLGIEFDKKNIGSHDCEGITLASGKTGKSGNCMWCYSDCVELVKDEPKYYNGKVICVERGYGKSTPLSCLTVGKVYTVENGYMVCDNGYRTEQYTDLDMLCVGMGHKLIPYVE